MANKDAMIDAVLFDLGGVVLEIDFERAFAHWADLAGVQAPTIQARYAVDEPYRQHERGEIDGAAYFAHLRQGLGVNLSDAQFEAGWNRIIISPIDEMPELLSSLADRLPIYAFSNTNDVHANHMRRHYHGLFGSFRSVFVSSELGLRKPESGAFIKVASMMNLDPARILFFDDLADNVDGARQVGMQAVQVSATDDIRRALQDYGLLTR